MTMSLFHDTNHGPNHMFHGLLERKEERIWSLLFCLALTVWYSVSVKIGNVKTKFEFALSEQSCCMCLLVKAHKYNPPGANVN